MLDLKIDLSKEAREAALAARLKEATRLLKRVLVAFPKSSIAREIVAFLSKDRE